MKVNSMKKIRFKVIVNACRDELIFGYFSFRPLYYILYYNIYINIIL